MFTRQASLRVLFRSALAFGLVVLPAPPLTADTHATPQAAPGSPARVVLTETGHRSDPAPIITYNAALDRLYALPPADPIVPTRPLIEIDPGSVTVLRTLTLPGHTRTLSTSTDGSRLFFDNALSSPTDQRITALDLNTATVAFQFQGVVTNTDFNYSGANITDVVPVPGAADSVVVAQEPWFGSGRQLRVFDHGIARASYYENILPILDLTFLENGQLAGRIQTLPSPQLLFFNLETTGPSLASVVPLPLDLAAAPLQFYDGLVYFANGVVFDPDTQFPVRTYALPSTGWAVAADPVQDRVHILTAPVDHPMLFSTRDAQGLGSLVLPGPIGESRTMRWAGPNRLAVVGGQTADLWVFTLDERAHLAFLPGVAQHDLTHIVRDWPIANRCGQFPVPGTGSPIAWVELCVTNVQERLDRQMVFRIRWTVTFLVSGPYYVTKGSDAGNPNMFALDQFDHRYDHVGLLDAAGQTITFTPGYTTTTGGYVFPPRQPGATVFRFHDDDQGVVIDNITITP